MLCLLSGKPVQTPLILVPKCPHPLIRNSDAPSSRKPPLTPPPPSLSPSSACSFSAPFPDGRILPLHVSHAGVWTRVCLPSRPAPPNSPPAIQHRPARGSEKRECRVEKRVTLPLCRRDPKPICPVSRRHRVKRRTWTLESNRPVLTATSRLCRPGQMFPPLRA